MEPLNDDQKQKHMDEYGLYYPSDEEWDSITKSLREDAAKPLTERDNLPYGLFIAAIFSKHLEEHIQEALTKADEREFITLLKESCDGYEKHLTGFDLIYHLEDIRERVSKYVADKTAKPSFKQSLYIQTGKAITDGINTLISYYQGLGTSVEKQAT